MPDPNNTVNFTDLAAHGDLGLAPGAASDFEERTRAAMISRRSELSSEAPRRQERKSSRWARRSLGVLALAGLAAGGTAVASRLDLADPPKSGAAASEALMEQAFNGPRLTSLPDAVRDDVSAQTEFYGLQAARAKSVPAPQGAKGSTWIVVPGTRGICVSIDRGSKLICGNADGFAAGTVLSTTQPSGEGPVPRDATSIDQIQTIGSGPARLDGVVPAYFTRVRIIDSDGDAVASAPIVGGAYEIKAPDARASYTVELEKADGYKVTIPH